jgi:Icc-related predicted phosphoesterase
VRIHVLSDLHLEFADFVPPAVDADVVVLAGDTATGVRGMEWAARAFPSAPVVAVAGNHEYYRESAPRIVDKLRDTARRAGVHFLENEAVEIGGVRFLGCSLWTDFRLFGRDPAVPEYASRRMSDYRAIRIEPEWRRMRPSDTTRWHAESLNWLQGELAAGDGRPTVVVTHHAPSARSMRPEHRDDWLSAAYASALDEVVEGSGAALWVHGHTHYSVSYAIGPTRVLANTRGYPDEPATGFDPALVVEVPDPAAPG